MHDVPLLQQLAMSEGAAVVLVAGIETVLLSQHRFLLYCSGSTQSQAGTPAQPEHNPCCITCPIKMTLLLMADRTAATPPKTNK